MIPTTQNPPPGAVMRLQLTPESVSTLHLEVAAACDRLTERATAEASKAAWQGYDYQGATLTEIVAGIALEVIVPKSRPKPRSEAA